MPASLSNDDVPSTRRDGSLGHGEAYVSGALEHIGGHTFQGWYLFLLGLPWLFNAMIVFASVFMTAKTHVEMKIDGGEATRLKCRVYNEVAPDKREILHLQNSIPADFGYVCKQDWRTAVLQMGYFVGFFCGLPALGMFSDARGRRPVAVISLIVLHIGIVIMLCALRYEVLVVGMYAIGFGMAGFGLSVFVWNVEVLRECQRVHTVWTFNVMFSLGQIAIALLATLLHSWRLLLLVAGLFGAVFYIYIPYLEESPKWLMAKGRDTTAYEVLCRIAKWNGSVPPSKPATKGTNGSNVEHSETTPLIAGPERNQTEEHIFTRLVRSGLMPRFLILCLSWFTTAMAYYGMAFNTPNLPLNLVWANVVNGVACLPAYILAVPLCEASWCGRRGCVAGGFVVACVCLLMSAYGQSSDTFLLATYYVASSANSLTFAAIYLYAAELFPTDIRNGAMSLQSMSARCGSLLAPAIASLGEESAKLPLILFAVPCALAGFLVMSLPETRSSEKKAEDAF